MATTVPLRMNLVAVEADTRCTQSTPRLSKAASDFVFEMLQTFLLLQMKEGESCECLVNRIVADMGKQNHS